MRTLRPGVRAQILAVALVPSAAVLLVGGAVTGLLITDARHASDWAAQMQQSLPETTALVTAVQRERLATMTHLAGDQSSTTRLAGRRAELDAALRAAAGMQTRMNTLDAEVASPAADFERLMGSLLAVRTGADTGRLPITDAYRFYSGLLDVILIGATKARDAVPDAEAGVELAEAMRLLRTAESLSRSTALGLALDLTDGTADVSATEFSHQSGYYRGELASFGKDLDEEKRNRTTALLGSAIWQLVTGSEDAALGRAAVRAGGGDADRSEATGRWSTAAEELAEQLLDQWNAHIEDTQRLADRNAAAVERNSWLTGAAVLTVAVLALAISLLLANRVNGRLRRLRAATMDLTDRRLPETMARLGADRGADGESFTLDLNFGTDEIGQVASAFERAASAAIGAAVTERRTREGVRTVFLNMARRSQVVVHRQLELLDQAEQKQENPALLETLFRLDHLATRERRNAENLVVLGGGQVGRRWRTAVTLVDLIRSAIAETLDYARVRVSRVPAVRIQGVAVADIVHLLAELVDNATAFSPPESRVELSGAAVADGVLIVIEDQGMGMTGAARLEANTKLTDVPDFGGAAPAADSRLGLFVVANLAARHAIRVELTESDYGGVRASVLLPSPLIAADAEELPTATGGSWSRSSH
ncbi:nitrate- and nitrite sensing domain-containing protein [Nocardia sp. NPDC057227]|uniref:sensor histidine kinase n=1 Tax=Nocardia sp. NPDC057227 TaxID=3346056 RepID=UPI00363281FF